jgi:hypothetical protein
VLEAKIEFCESKNTLAALVQNQLRYSMSMPQCKAQKRSRKKIAANKPATNSTLHCFCVYLAKIVRLVLSNSLRLILLLQFVTSFRASIEEQKKNE